MKGEIIFLLGTMMTMAYSVSRVPTKSVGMICYVRKIKEVRRGGSTLEADPSGTRSGRPNAQIR
jgi:hypothetical protein